MGDYAKQKFMDWLSPRAVVDSQSLAVHSGAYGGTSPEAWMKQLKAKGYEGGQTKFAGMAGAGGPDAVPDTENVFTMALYKQKFSALERATGYDYFGSYGGPIGKRETDVGRLMESFRSGESRVDVMPLAERMDKFSKTKGNGMPAKTPKTYSDALAYEFVWKGSTGNEALGVPAKDPLKSMAKWVSARNLELNTQEMQADLALIQRDRQRTERNLRVGREGSTITTMQDMARLRAGKRNL